MKVGRGERNIFGKGLISHGEVWCEVRMDDERVPDKLKRLYRLFCTLLPSPHNEPKNVSFVSVFDPEMPRPNWRAYFCHAHYEEGYFTDLVALLTFMERMTWELGAVGSYVELLDLVAEKLIVGCYIEDSRNVPLMVRRAVKELLKSD